MSPKTVLSLLLFTCALVAPAQKRTLTPSDYKQWETITSSEISRDGRWLAYTVSLVEGDGRLTVRNNDAPTVWITNNGMGAQFSDDSKWVAYLVSPPKAIADKLREEKKPIENKLGLRALASGEEQVFDSVQRFRFLKGSKYLLAHRYRGAEKKEGGSDLLVLDLSTGESLTVGNVTDAQPNQSETLLALEIESDSGFKGVQVLDPRTNTLRTLAWGRESIHNLTWASKADVLAFLSGKADEKKEGELNTIVVATGFASGRPAVKAMTPNGREGFAKDSRVSELGALLLNDEGTRVAFGSQPWKDRVKSEIKPQDKPGVEVWHSKDLRVLPQQKVMANFDRRRSALWVWDLKADDLAQVTDGELEGAILLGDYETALLMDPKPYLTPATNGISYQDVYLLKVDSRSKTRILEKAQFGVSASRTGRFVAHFDRGHWRVYDVHTEKWSDLTKGLGVTFENSENDLTIPQKPAASQPVWLADDSAVILHDRYDAWLFRLPNGSPTRLTNGRTDRQIHRFTDIQDDAEGPALDQPFYFRVIDEREKASGYYLSNNRGEGKMLALDHVSFSGLTKAKDADRLIFRMGTFDKSPNIYVTNSQFTQAKPETNTNPQQSQFHWGKAELVPFKSRWGKELNGILIYPADYDPKLRYPMVTYVYERLSDGLHGYHTPQEHSAYNVQVLSQNGYFVFMPDIAYKGRTPGQNAVDCLEPALNAVFAKKVGVDPDRVGLMGHSWGGYQTAFVTTVSKMFRVGVAGAPLTELTSMYNSFYWNSGVSDQQLMETGQGRLEVPFWEDPKTYFDNSPVWQSQKRTSPILIAFGDKDGAVDYHQGLYLYQTLRRMGKECVLLLYADENHGLAKRPNQLDYARRVRHYLDVYLKGLKPEPWVSQGVSYLDQAK